MQKHMHGAQVAHPRTRACIARLSVERFACTRRSDCSATPQPSTPALRRVGALGGAVWCGALGGADLRSGSSCFGGLDHASPNDVLWRSRCCGGGGDGFSDSGGCGDAGGDRDDCCPGGGL